MSGTESNFEGVTTEKQKGTKAEIVRKEIMFNNIRIRCPVDFTEHEIPAETKKFICPVDRIILLLA